MLDIKFARIKAVTFALRPAPEADLLAALKKRLGPTPGVYSGEPAVLDFSAWSETESADFPVHLPAFIELLKTSGVHPVEVRGSLPELENQAEELGLRFESGQDAVLESQPPPPLVETRALDVDEPGSTPEAAQDQAHASSKEPDSGLIPQEAGPARRTLVIDHAVRSGQKIYAQGADLIVMGQVSAGAEVIADGHVHVYGVLRGRALAGAAGDTQARIMSTCFEAELVAVAGYYLTFEGGFPEENRSKPTLIHLDQGTEPAVLRLKAFNIR